MNEMVERVAKAIIARRGLPANVIINWDVIRTDARAAIEAMREPTKQMVSAGLDVKAYDGVEEMDSYGDPESVFKALIDEALKD